jgi:O-acetyl-ADP-ribose deacetylase (regulator of RNase III)
MIIYVTGDVTKPVGGSSHNVIVHVCNDLGAWGAGVSGAIGRRWPKAERLYRLWAASRKLPAHENNFPSFELGNIQIVQVGAAGADIRVVNLIGQNGLRSRANPHPVRYDAIREGLRKLVEIGNVDNEDTIVHMPMIGCGLAGGRWEDVRPIVTDELTRKNVAVYVYNL